MIHHKGLLDGWAVIDTLDGVHVVPRNDVRFHVVSQDRACACEPELWQQGGHPVVVHRSYDGRELVEPLTDVLS